MRQRPTLPVSAPRTSGGRETRRARVLTVLLLVALTLAPLGVSAVAGPPADDPGLVESTAQEPARDQGFTAIGSLALPGFNADVWGHKGFAYIGSWGNSTPGRCPAAGVRIIDLANPRTPTLVGAVAAIPGTTQEDVEVVSVKTPAFTGDLLVTGVQACIRTAEAPRGLDLWDVSNPRAPRHLAFWPSGPFGSGGASGVHEFHIFQRGERVYVAAAVSFSEQYEGQGDFRLVDVTDPRQPVQVSAWGATADAGIRPGPGQFSFAHSAWTNRAGTLAALSYWDAGAILLDISDPTKPRFLGRTPYPAGAEGNTHSAWIAEDDTLLLTTDEDFVPAGGWGFLRLWDIRNPAAPVEIGRFATPNTSASPPPGPGQYSVHNPFVRGQTVYLSWFSDGVRVVDLADPRAPVEIAAYVPPPVADPFEIYPELASVWGVYLEGDLVLISDVNAGLYVLEALTPAPRYFPETDQYLGGRFLDYWLEHGGLAINGYPISGERLETLEDGKQYRVQYFERTRLEYHPENPPPYDILLGQFGRRIRPADPPVPAEAGASADVAYFGQTGHTLRGRFRQYWEQHGGLAQFGFPISEVIRERLEDGKEYEVQYFERARFEYHPENAGTPFEVLLGQFGRRIFTGR